MIKLVEDRNVGTYNGVGPGFNMSMRQFVYGAHAVFNSSVNYIRIDDYDFLEKNQLMFQAPWILDNKPKFAGMSNVNTDRIINSGVVFRPLAETIRDTHAWWYSDAVTEERRQKFLSSERSMVNRQAALIKAWNEHVK